MGGRQRGVALITVMLVVALATTAAVHMASRQQIDIRRTENTLYDGQALMYLLGVESWARQFLADDRRKNKIDHLGEDWALRLPPLPIEGGTLSGRIDDLQARFNLHNLVAEGEAGKVARARFARLLRILELPAALANRIEDWQDSDIEARFPDGAEDDTYLGQTPPYRAANRPMAHVSELRLIRDLTEKDYETLLPYVTALPRPTPINVNTASATVLASLADDLPLAEIEALLEKREDSPWNSVQDFLAEPVFAGKAIPEEGLSVGSDFFRIEAEVMLGQSARRLRSIVIREDDGRNTIYARSEGDF